MEESTDLKNENDLPFDLYTKNEERFSSLKFQFKIYWVFYFLAILVAIIDVVLGLNIDDYSSIDYWGVTETSVLDIIAWVLGIINLIISIVLFRTSAFFVRSVYHSLSLKRRIKFSYKEGFLSWFIPVIWWFRPYQIMKNIETERKRIFPVHSGLRSHSIKRWWIFFLIYFWSDIFFIYGLQAIWEYIYIENLFGGDWTAYSNFLNYFAWFRELVVIVIGLIASLEFVKIAKDFLNFQNHLIDEKIGIDITEHLIQ